MAKTELQYKTFDELLSEVTSDLYTFDLEGMIDPAQLIKVAQRVNYELGLRIYQPKDVILDVEKGKARLPLDFYVLNYANLCGKYTVSQPIITGTQIEEKVLDPQYTNDSACVKPCVSACGNYVNLVQSLKSEIRTYDVFYPLNFTSGKLISTECPNLSIPSDNRAYLKDGFLFTNLETAQVHLNYMGNLEDRDGNLLVLDNPLVNEFYEYALKQRILENLYLNGEDVAQRIQIIEQRLRAARNNALSLVNTPDYAEMYKVWETNRKAMYGKYYEMFKR
jgi:hypothetical protein